MTASSAPVLIDTHGMPLRARASVGAAHRAGDRFSQEMARFVPPLRSADDAYLSERNTIAARIHYMVDNNGWASGQVTRYVDQALGANFRLAAQPDYRALGLDAEWAFEWAREVETRFRAYANDPRHYCDAGESRRLSGLLALSFRHMMADGEALAVAHWLPREDFQWATAFQVIDPDRLSNERDKPDGPLLRGGVEINRLGAPMAYWIRDGHPGDFFALMDAQRWTRVERKAPGLPRAQVIHFFEAQRAGQTRGKSLLGPIVERLKMLDQYERVEIQAALTNAIYTAYIESPFDPEFTEDALTGAPGYQAQRMAFHDASALTLDGQRLPMLFPGEKVNFQTAARPNTGFADFERAVLRYIAACAGTSYEELSQDWSNTNYSSARAGLLGTYKFLSARTGNFTHGVATPVYALWLEEELDRDPDLLPSGAPSFWEAPAAWCRCRWYGPGRGWVDPTKEAQAALMRMDSGLSTLEDEAAEQGRDWVEVLESQAFERRLRAEMGLPNPTWAVVAETSGGGSSEEEDPDQRDARERAEASGPREGRSIIPVTRP